MANTPRDETDKWGSPALPKRTAHFTLRMTDHERRLLRKAAYKRGVSDSDMVRMLIRNCEDES